MKQYVYLSETKINMLYDQLYNEEEIEYSFDGELSVGVASGSSSQKHKEKINLYHKLETVIRNLPNVGNVADNAEYIKGTMPMAWNNRNLIDKSVPATFWIGESEELSDEYADRTMVFLIGSAHNIIGSNYDKSEYYSTSYIDAFFQSFNNSINYETLECTSSRYSRRIEQDIRLINAINNNSGYSSEEKEETKKHVLDGDMYSTNYMDKLYESYYGNYSEYKFIARRIFSTIRIDEKESFARYIIATPLYVVAEPFIRNRTVNVKGKRKYLLTQKEWKMHKKRAYEGLATLLLSERLIEEEKAFTQEMKQLYAQYGRKLGMSNKENREQFISDAIPIVQKYFMIKHTSEE